MAGKPGNKVDEHSKDRDLEPARRDPGERLTTNQGVPVADNQNSLKAGTRGPTLMEDFIFREKMTHFDHESIPERVVHARGSGAHGFFQVYESLSDLTSAAVFADPSVKTPVFVRFSTVVGSRGSADTVRDVRGFATKFYTSQGVWDLVGNNMPVFFIQDAMKFPDLVHAIKPQPNNEIPQASAAHDTFWDFASLMPEITHMLLWVLSDRAIPRSYAMMEGFGVHTFRLLNAEGKGTFVKFHWIPTLGAHSLVWDETQKLAGKNPDFNREDLWERIEQGNFPEFELGLQIVPEEDEHKFDFDLLDATKIIPEEEVPIRRVGKMTLNRNPDNFFSEIEQAAFHVGHVVPGIDFTNDPLLQGRLFSYLDTQLNRFHSANFHELPINSPVVPVENNQEAGFMRRTIRKGRVNYEPNSLAGGCPMQAGPGALGAFHSHMERMDGQKVRKRSESFSDHFSQATLFWNSMTEPEKEHIVEAAHFELGKVETQAVRERIVELFNHVDHDFARRVARGIGVAEPSQPARPNHGRSSPSLSMEADSHRTVRTARTRKVAILAADGVSDAELNAVRDALKAEGVMSKVISTSRGSITGSSGTAIEVDKTFITAGSIMFDAVYVPGGKSSIQTLRKEGDAIHFINEAFRHCKPIGATSEGVDLLAEARMPGVMLPSAADTDDVRTELGVVTLRNSGSPAGVAAKVKGAVGAGSAAQTDNFSKALVDAIAQHRHWGRTLKSQVPA